MVFLRQYNSLYEDAISRYYQKIGKNIPKKLQRKSTFSKLEKYSNKDVYISFRDIERIGINPKTVYDTPVGVYAYPLKAIWNLQDRHNFDPKTQTFKVPFAGTQPYIYILKTKGRGIYDIGTYSEIELQNDLKILIKKLRLYSKKLNRIVKLKKKSLQIPNTIKNYKDYILHIYNDSFKYAKQSSSPGGKLWYITRRLAIELSDNKKQLTIALWTSILKNILKYNYVGDRGSGIIHANEPYQIVFFTPKAYTVLELIDNKLKNPETIGKETKEEGLIWSSEAYSQLYDFAIDQYVRDYSEKTGKDWRVPTMTELFNVKDLSGFVRNSFYWASADSVVLTNKYVRVNPLTKIVAKDTTIISNIRLVRDIKTRRKKQTSVKSFNIKSNYAEDWLFLPERFIYVDHSDKLLSMDTFIDENAPKDDLYSIEHGILFSDLAKYPKYSISEMFLNKYNNWRLPTINEMIEVSEMIKNNSEGSELWKNKSFLEYYVTDISYNFYVFNIVTGSFRLAKSLTDISNVVLKKF